jgi:hypothetical protein
MVGILALFVLGMLVLGFIAVPLLMAWVAQKLADVATGRYPSRPHRETRPGGFEVQPPRHEPNPPPLSNMKDPHP